MSKYDDLDWHYDAAVDAGHEENAFAHAGLYLEWVICHDLHNPSWHKPTVEAVVAQVP